MGAENLIGNVPNKVAGEYQRPLPRDIDLASNGSNAWKDETGTYSWDKMGVLPPALSVADFSIAPLTEVDGAIYIGTTDTTAVHADWDSANKYDWARFTSDTSSWSSITPSEGQLCYDASANTWFTSDTSTVGWLELQTVIGTTSFTTKTLEIGDWDMDATQILYVAHGLSATEWKTIRSVKTIIRNDADTSYEPLVSLLSALSSVLNGGESLTSTDINLYRSETGEFNSTAFDSTAYNRGWVTIDYTKD